MKKWAKNILKKVYLDGFAARLNQNLIETKRHISWNIERKFGRLDTEIITSYIDRSGIKKVQIGCGANIHSDWLNTSFFPTSDKVIHLDASKKFPLPNDTFDYIFSEHMIEHITYPEGLVMLGECYRILKHNGTIRLSTPKLDFLIELYQENKSELQQEYIKWATDISIEHAPYYDDVFVINNYVRNWGHLFIYDEKTLRSSMEKAGFTKIERCNLNESEHEALRNLENEMRMPKGFLNLESVILEGTKVADN
jgi:predicted SAM-dependent methyltransferase